MEIAQIGDPLTRVKAAAKFNPDFCTGVVNEGLPDDDAGGTILSFVPLEIEN